MRAGNDLGHHGCHRRRHRRGLQRITSLASLAPCLIAGVHQVVDSTAGHGMMTAGLDTMVANFIIYQHGVAPNATR
jgi:hypothetical protein